MRASRSETRRPAASLDSLAIDGERISARLRIGSTEHELAYRVPGVPLEPRYEPFLVAALPIAMRAASSLSVPGPVSPRLLKALPMAQEILATWSEPLSPVSVEAAAGVTEPDRERGTASLFSGGVDSFYTALGNLDEIDALVYVHGFDVLLASRGLRARISRSLNAAAEALGRPLIEVESNVRDTSDHFISTWFHHGAHLAGVGHLLGARFRRVLVPATLSYKALPPLGSHPLLDPLWSTEAVEVIHEGVVGRAEKVIEISGSEVAMRHLRVCWEQDTDYNCGRCPKCVRTAAVLHLIGALERCHTLPDRVPLRALARARVRNEASLGAVRGSLAAAEREGTDPWVTRALRHTNRRGTLYVGLKPVASGAAPRLWRAGGRVQRWFRGRRRERRLAAAARAR